MRRAEGMKKVQELIEFMDLAEAKDRKIGKYSGGMKQKIGIASGLVHDPEILILDEPTANLDPIGRADLIAKIKKLSVKMSVFVSSHILSEIEQMCEKVTMINKGKIILTDTIKNIKERYNESANTFVLDTNMNKKVLEYVKQKSYVTSAWIDDTDKKIHIVPKDNKVFQESIPIIIAENNVNLKGFFQQEASLQDIFIDIIEGDE
jgi:ABC-2 type transport system ATP-binding protein